MAKTVSKGKENNTKTKKEKLAKPGVKKSNKKENLETQLKSKKEIHTKEKKVVAIKEVVLESTKTKVPVKKFEVENIPDVTIEKKLIALYSLQQVDNEINKIRIVRGELPLEVQDLEDEIAGLETRIENLKTEIKDSDAEIKAKKAAIKDHQAQIKRYEAQQMNVRNNREYDSITKEIEFQTLEIQLCEKKIKEYTSSLDLKNEISEQTNQTLNDRIEDLKQKKIELEEIVSETEKEEKKLVDKLQESQKFIEDRLITAYQRIKKNARNGLAVVLVERDACGGCFNKIPPQRQLDIKMHKKIIVCEYCGRILVDSSIDEMVKSNI